MRTNFKPTPLTTDNFFKYFIHKPWSKHLETTDKIKACLASGVLAFFLFVPHLVCKRFFYDKSVKKVVVNPPPEPKTAAIKDDKFSPRLPPSPQPASSPSPKLSPPPVAPQAVDITPAPASIYQSQLLFYPEERTQNTIPTGFTEYSFPRHIKHLSDYPLKDWLARKEPEKHWGKTHEQRDAINRSIDARMESLNQAVQLETRLEAIKERYQTGINALTLTDLELPYNESGLSIVLLSDEEFGRLTLEQIKKMPPRQLQLVKVRHALTFKKDVQSISKIFDPSMTLRDFCSLCPRCLNDYLQNIDPLFIGFITTKQLQGLSTMDLSPAQFAVLFPKDNPEFLKWSVQQLCPFQVASCVTKNLMEKEHLQALSPEQLKNLDFGTCTMDQAKFDGLFISWGLDQTAYNQSRVQHLKSAQIQALWSFFDESRTFYLRPEQLKEIDFRNLALTSEQLKGLFPDHKTVSEATIIARLRVQKLDLEKHVYPLLPRLSGIQLRYLSVEQLKQLNFRRQPLTKDQFDGLFVSWHLDKTAYEQSRVSQLSSDQVVALLPHFDKARMFCLRAEQLQEIDFNHVTLNKDQVAGLFPEEGGRVTEATLIALERRKKLDAEKHISPLMHLLSLSQRDSYKL